VDIRCSHVAFNQEFRGDSILCVGMSMQQPLLRRLVYGEAGSDQMDDTFPLDDEDVEIITPSNGGLHNLPIGVGAVLLTLGLKPKVKVQDG
jgi:hypothetical protein